MRVGRMEITPGELRIERHTARLNSVPVKKCDQDLAAATLTAYLIRAFSFHGAELDSGMGAMIINDILDMYGWMSPLEIVKAINEGRQNCGDLYGKLSGRHVLDWLAAYDRRMQQDLARHHQNRKYEEDKETAGLITKLLENQRKPKAGRPEPSHADKVRALQERYDTISDAERKRREYSRAWNYEEHGDYEQYMKNYDNEN